MACAKSQKNFSDICLLKSESLLFTKRSIVFVFIIICLLPVKLVALDFQLFPFDLQLTEYIQEYHKQPNPQEALDRFFDLDVGNFEKVALEVNRPHSRPVLMAFYANVLGQNSELVLPFTNRLIKESIGAQASFGTEIVAYGSTENRKEALALIVKRYNLPPESASAIEALRVLPYSNMEAVNKQILDIIWACYFATSDDNYIEKIAEPLAYWQPSDEALEKKVRSFTAMNPITGTKEYKEWYGIITAQAAMFGLTENASASPSVLRALIKLSEKREDKVGQLLKTIASQVENSQAKQDIGNLTEESKTSGTVIRGSEVNSTPANPSAQ